MENPDKIINPSHFILWIKWHGIWKYHADEKYQAKKSLSDVAEGDKVLQKQRCKKMPSNFEAEPYKVVSKKRNNVTVRACYLRKVTYNYVKKYR